MGHQDIQINASLTFLAGINLFILGLGFYGLLVWTQEAYGLELLLAWGGSITCLMLPALFARMFVKQELPKIVLTHESLTWRP